MPRAKLSIDHETFSLADLTKVGVSRYSRHPSTQCLMSAYAVDEQEIDQTSLAEGQDYPRWFLDALVDPEVEKWAWNAPFEINIFQQTLGIELDVSQWYDAMVLSLTCSLPGKLEKAGPVVDLAAEDLKDPEGDKLMRLFSFPTTRETKARAKGEQVEWWEDYEKWLRYLGYNRRDVRAERAIRRRLLKYQPAYTDWADWHMDQAINAAGIPINMPMVRNAILIYEAVVAARSAEMAELTGLENPGSLKQLLPWLKENGYPFDDCVKGHIQRGYERAREEGNWLLERVLELRLEISRTSPTKFHALERATDDDGYLRYALQFAGAARTWRWAGRIWQPQNLPRPTKTLEKQLPAHAKAVELLDPEAVELVYSKPMDLLATCIRPAAQAPEGYVFVDADLNAIENRVLGWLADCPKILDVFRLDRDPYIAFAVYLFGGTYEALLAEYKGGDSYKRTISKPGVLGCGYMLGPGEEHYNRKTGEREATGLLGYAWNMQVKEFTHEQSKLSVETFRREFEEVKDYWYGIERAAKACIRTGKPQEFGFVTFDMKQPFMRMRLPSSRYLHYCRPKIESVMAPWGEKKPTITYEGLNERKQWVRESTHPGKLTENADQAISRDLLVHGMRLARKEGIDIRLHVHDQIVGLALKSDAERQLDVLRECMGQTPHWAPGLPMKANGFISEVFMKD